METIVAGIIGYWIDKGVVWFGSLALAIWAAVKGKQRLPAPQAIALGLVVLAALLVIDAHFTQWAESYTRKPEQVIRAWLDSGGYQSRIDNPNPNENFRLTVSGDLNFSIYQEKRTPGLLVLESSFSPPQRIRDSYTKLTRDAREFVFNTVEYELLAHNAEHFVFDKDGVILNVKLIEHLPFSINSEVEYALLSKIFHMKTSGKLLEVTAEQAIAAQTAKAEMDKSKGKVKKL